MRHLRSLIWLAGLSLILAVPITAAAQDATPTETKRNLAPEEIADQAIDTLELFIERSSSENPKVRHRAWEMLTPNAQANMFFGLEDAFFFVEGIILEVGDVTVEEPGIGIEVALQGLWHRYDFSNTFFVLTDDATMIDDGHIVLGDLTIPDGLTSTKVTIKFGDDKITTRSKPLATKDIVLATFTNEGQADHEVIVLRLADGQTVEDLLAKIETNEAGDYYNLVFLKSGESTIRGIMGVTPGQYVITGFRRGPNEVDSLLGIRTTLTIVA